MSLTSNLHRLAPIFVAIILMVGTAAAQTCVDDCNAARYTGRDACDATFADCMAAAAGNPIAEAACLQQLTRCYGAADSVFIACVSHCPSHPCSSMCDYNAGVGFAFCRDAAEACGMNGGSPEQCAAALASCQAGVSARWRQCFMASCVTPRPLAVQSRPWGTVKLLYR